jgi:hypothetical protein
VPIKIAISKKQKAKSKKQKAKSKKQKAISKMRHNPIKKGSLSVLKSFAALFYL